MKDKLNWGLLSKYRTELYGVATLMIMVFHCQHFIQFPGILNTIGKHLNYGVDIFLLLSGICLYFSFSKDSNYGTFMKKRCERTLVPYLIIGLFFWIWKYIIAEPDILDFLYNASGFSLILLKRENYLVIGEPTIWYVAFIMAMYAIYPIIYNAYFKTTEKRSKQNFAAMLLFAFAISLFIKAYTPASFDEAEISLTRIPVFLMGCYFGKAVKEKQKFRLQDYILFFMCIPLKLIISFIIKSNDIIFHRYLGLFAAFLICFAVVFVLEAVSNIKFIITPVKKVLTFFGTISLEVYIIHVMLYNALLYYIPDIRTTDAFAYWQKALIYVGILVVSTVLSVIFNKAYNAIKSKKKAVA
ncbi:MAG: acyltransferase [Clostridia bacterium]|nr:acyltransferase [Clostridia bacterium]